MKNNNDKKEGHRGFDLIKFIVVIIVIYTISLYLIIQGVEMAFGK